MVMMMVLVGHGVRTVSVLLVLFPHLGQCLSPANDLQQMETGFLVAAAVALQINHCYHFVQVNRTKQPSIGTAAD